MVYVVVMGCGRVGSSLAGALSRLGHEVAVVDRDEGAFRRLGPEFTGRTVVGMGFDRAVLVEAGIERADALAAVSSGDNSNIISARVARETFGVEHVVARIYDAKRAAVYERLGIPTVATVPWTTDRLLHTLIDEGDSARWRDPSGAVTVVEAPVHEQWVGKRVTELEDAVGARVAFLTRFGAGVLPDLRTAVQAEDRVYLAAVSGSVAEVLAAAATAPVDEN